MKQIVFQRKLKAGIKKFALKLQEFKFANGLVGKLRFKKIWLPCKSSAKVWLLHLIPVNKLKFQKSFESLAAPLHTYKPQLI